MQHKKTNLKNISNAIKNKELKLGKCVLIFTLSFSLTFLFVNSLIGSRVSDYSSDIYLPIDYSDSLQIDLINKCSNYTLELTSYCLSDYISTYFNYTINPDYNILSDYELISNGGDCLDYTRFYVKYLNKLGYPAKTIRIPSGIKDGLENYHIFLVTYDQTGYCLIDLKSVECKNYN